MTMREVRPTMFFSYMYIYICIYTYENIYIYVYIHTPNMLPEHPDRDYEGGPADYVLLL
jgi:hypothetical protein